MREDRLPFQSIKNKHGSDAVYRSVQHPFPLKCLQKASTTAAHSEMERQQPLWNSSLLLQKVCIPLRQRLLLKATFYESSAKSITEARNLILSSQERWFTSEITLMLIWFRDNA